MKRSWWGAAAVAAAMGMAAPSAGAQVFTPTFMAPRVSNDVGIYYSDYGDFALEGILRTGFSGSNVGLRVGVAEPVGEGDTFLTLGADLRSPIAVSSAPVDLAFIGGVQALVGNGSAVGGQGGVSLGYTFTDPGFSITPYVAPRVALISANDESDLEVLADLGIDLSFSPNVSVRFGAGLGKPQANWGLGVSWRR